jgi:two-component system, response regulator PdtaR
VNKHAGPPDAHPQRIWLNKSASAALSTAILIVDDEPLVRAADVCLFEDAGFRVIPARNGEEAMALLEANGDVKLLFTDVDLPGAIDGLALAWSVRDRWPHIGILVASGQWTLQPDELPAGSRFYRKPYNTKIVVMHARLMTK